LEQLGSRGSKLSNRGEGVKREKEIGHKSICAGEQCRGVSSGKKLNRCREIAEDPHAEEEQLMER